MSTAWRWFGGGSVCFSWSYQFRFAHVWGSQLALALQMRRSGPSSRVWGEREEKWKLAIDLQMAFGNCMCINQIFGQKSELSTFGLEMFGNELPSGSGRATIAKRRFKGRHWTEKSSIFGHINKAINRWNTIDLNKKRLRGQLTGSSSVGTLTATLIGTLTGTLTYTLTSTLIDSNRHSGSMPDAHSVADALTAFDVLQCSTPRSLAPPISTDWPSALDEEQLVFTLCKQLKLSHWTFSTSNW